MARCVDQVEVVDLPITGLVMQRSGLRLDGYPALFFDVHRVEHLCFHVAFCEAAAALDQAVCECGFPMVNVRNDREISDVVHQGQASSV